jgi:hypothetical protein
MTQSSTFFDGLDTTEIDYVQARANAASDAEALRIIGKSKGWLRNRDKDDLNQRALDFKTDNVLKAQLVLDENLEKAAQGLAKLLDSRNENIKLKAQTEIMDRRMGKPTQKIDQKTEITDNSVINDGRFDRAISTLADAIRESVPDKGTGADGDVDTPK